VSDSHLRILRMIAKRWQRELDHDDVVDPVRGSEPSDHRRDLEQAAGQANANVAAAEARRRHPQPGRTG
jgi:hypothetical protein